MNPPYNNTKYLVFNLPISSSIPITPLDLEVTMGPSGLMVLAATRGI
jgi:hypothetical protein